MEDNEPYCYGSAVSALLAAATAAGHDPDDVIDIALDVHEQLWAAGLSN
jgi:hypothetical protein